jgi:hypothetical protein
MAQTASKAYGERMARIGDIVDDLPRLLGNMTADAQRVHWGHAGDLARIEELARELADAIEATRLAHIDAGATQ